MSEEFEEVSSMLSLDYSWKTRVTKRLLEAVEKDQS
jgi:hypothetical protein